MGRNNDFGQESSKKTLFYGIGSLCIIVLLACIAFYILLNGGPAKEESQFSTAKIDGLVPNNEISNSFNSTKETSFSIGKSVNEAANNLSTVTNSIKTENTVVTKQSPKNEISSKKDNSSSKSNKEKNVNETENNVQTSTKVEEKDPVFVKPVEGEIIKEYAKDKLVYSDTLKEWITHPGVDIKAEKTSVVKAAADGRVSAIKNDPRYGLTVVIEHQNGFKTVYSNLLTAEFVTEGEEVTSGQTIGTVGNTATFEVTDTEHLHFEILKNNEIVDPCIYIQ